MQNTTQEQIKKLNADLATTRSESENEIAQLKDALATAVQATADLEVRTADAAVAMHNTTQEQIKKLNADLATARS
eukprot:scaffold16525_cov96-Isochrysis_galbana.AAC.1